MSVLTAQYSNSSLYTACTTGCKPAGRRVRVPHHSAAAASHEIDGCEVHEVVDHDELRVGSELPHGFLLGGIFRPQVLQHVGHFTLRQSAVRKRLCGHTVQLVINRAQASKLKMDAMPTFLMAVAVQ